MTDPAPLVRTDRRDHVLVVAMEREAKRNAIDRAVADQLSAALDLLDDDDDLWVGVLTGTPAVFSAGSDLTAGGDYLTDRGGAYGIIRRGRRKPLIAAVEGPALGGGLEIVLACDGGGLDDRELRPTRSEAGPRRHLRRALPRTSGPAPEPRPRARAHRRPLRRPPGPTPPDS